MIIVKFDIDISLNQHSWQPETQGLPGHDEMVIYLPSGSRRSSTSTLFCWKLWAQCCSGGKQHEESRAHPEAPRGQRSHGCSDRPSENQRISASTKPEHLKRPGDEAKGMVEAVWALQTLNLAIDETGNRKGYQSVLLFTRDPHRCWSSSPTAAVWSSECSWTRQGSCRAEPIWGKPPSRGITWQVSSICVIYGIHTLWQIH